MKTRILLSLAVLAGVLDARAQRNCAGLALGNTAPADSTPPGNPGAAVKTPAPDLAAENALLRKENAALQQNQAQLNQDEKTIRAKMAAGLPRPQAEQAVQNQRRFDQAKRAVKAFAR